MAGGAVFPSSKVETRQTLPSGEGQAYALEKHISAGRHFDIAITAV